MGVCETEGVAEDGSDGTPDLWCVSLCLGGVWVWQRDVLGAAYINDLETLFQKLISIVGKMVFNTVLGRSVGLVNVNSESRAARYLPRRPIMVILWRTTDRMIEDEDSRGSRASQSRQSQVLIQVQ